jgi:hypothetical protein
MREHPLTGFFQEDAFANVAVYGDFVSLESSAGNAPMTVIPEDEQYKQRVAQSPRRLEPEDFTPSSTSEVLSHSLAKNNRRHRPLPRSSPNEDRGKNGSTSVSFETFSEYVHLLAVLRWRRRNIILRSWWAATHRLTGRRLLRRLKHRPPRSSSSLLTDKAGEVTTPIRIRLCSTMSLGTTRHLGRHVPTRTNRTRQKHSSSSHLRWRVALRLFDHAPRTRRLVSGARCRRGFWAEANCVVSDGAATPGVRFCRIIDTPRLKYFGK